jgi:nucleobase:cation symporter-1, NCS1 family
VPQTIQSRAQFGFYGSAFLFPAVLLINVGFIAAQLVIRAQAMRGVTGVVSIPQWILILTVRAVVIGVFGYRWIHRVMQATAVVVGVPLVVMLVQGLRYGVPARARDEPGPPVGRAVAGVALLVIDMLSFGPFVSDYTRYLPAQTPIGSACLAARRVFSSVCFGEIATVLVSEGGLEHGNRGDLPV